VCFQDDRAAALKAYSKERSCDAKVLVEESWRADQGFIYFVLPIIMDKLFKKIVPWLFADSMFQLMGRSKLRIAHVRWRKRLDRVMQFTVIGSIIAVLLKLLVVAGRKLGRMIFAG
jgi:kynurenine 3-monooxygenase